MSDTIKFTKPFPIPPEDIQASRPQKYFKSPEIVATDDDAIGGKGTTEVYTESAGSSGAGVATASPKAASFVYLDVGLWAGAGKSPSTWPKSRDFGLIHGPIVLLCTFSTQDGEELDDSEKQTSDHFDASVAPGEGSGPDQKSAIDYSGNLLEVVAHLSTGPNLGKVWVRKQFIAKTQPTNTSTDPSKEPIEPIYLIVGDMHIPVADKVDPGKSGDRVPRHGRIDMKPLEAAMEAIVPLNAKDDQGNPVDSMARMNAVVSWVHGTGSDVVTDAMNKNWFSLAMKVAPGLFSPLPGKLMDQLDKDHKYPLHTTQLDEFIRVAKEVWDSRDDVGVVEDTMSWDDANDWFQNYRVGINGKPPADISETGAADFYELATLINSCNQRSRIQFMQLGDMIDYWIGFSAYYKPSDSPYLPVEPDTAIKVITKRALLKRIYAELEWFALGANETEIDLLAAPLGVLGPTFKKEVQEHQPADPSTVDYREPLPPGRCMSILEHWTKNLFNSTEHGKVLREALVILSKMPLEPIYLAGNHDNYLGSATVGTALSKVIAASAGSFGRSAFPQRLQNWRGNGIWMEHGHQPDTSNGNAVDTMPVGLLIGTDSPDGVFLTQPAFLRPKDMRTAEGRLEKALYDVKLASHQDPGFGERFNALANAITLHDTIDPFRIYVMGHTHSPIGLNVTIATKPRVGPHTKGDALFASNADVTFAGADHVTKDSAQYENVEFFWADFPTEVIGAGHVNLEDPWGPQRKPIRGYPRNHVHKPPPLRFGIPTSSGKITLPVVPPGCLVPRFYEGDDDDVFVWTGDRLFFAGVSFDSPQSMFAPKQSIPLRWCVPIDRKYPADQIFFEMFGTAPLSTGGTLTNFCGQQLALDPTLEGEYAHGRTTLKASSTIVTRVAELCSQQLEAWNTGDLSVEEEAGRKAIALDYYVVLIASAKPIAVQEGAVKAAVPHEKFDEFGQGRGNYMFGARLRMRVPVPDSMR